jgi:hypothetical protein
MNLPELHRAIQRRRREVFAVDDATYSEILWRIPLDARKEWDEYIPIFTPRGIVQIRHIDRAIRSALEAGKLTDDGIAEELGCAPGVVRKARLQRELDPMQRLAG